MGELTPLVALRLTANDIMSRFPGILIRVDANYDKFNATVLVGNASASVKGTYDDVDMWLTGIDDVMSCQAEAIRRAVAASQTETST